MPPCPVARSTSSKIRFLSSALNLRRSGLAGTSGSELARKGTAILLSLTMILLAALLCNYGRGKCLIIIGTEGNRLTKLLPGLNFFIRQTRIIDRPRLNRASNESCGAGGKQKRKYK